VTIYRLQEGIDVASDSETMFLKGRIPRHRHPRRHPRDDRREDVGVDVDVGVVECGL